MCVWGKTKKVKVLIPSDLSYTGKQRYAFKAIDFCIADIVKMLNRCGVVTIASCCGHGKRNGEILLQDGRKLIIKGGK